VLGGEWQGACYVVERRYEPSRWYGREQVGAISTRLSDAAGEAALVAGGSPACPPFVFFDLETTGLAGGAGTYAFLVGCGRCEADGAFVTRQFLLVRHGDERELLAAVGDALGAAGALVSFNGKSFDAPLLEMRHLFHRLEWAAGRTPHLDVLHPARRFWGGPDNSLIALEAQLLGAMRTGDVPGFEIPSRYFQFVRSGDAGPLAAVLEHNRLDLLSLAGLTARLLDLVRQGPEATADAQEALALGRVYARGGLDARACESYQRAVMVGKGARASTTRIDALRSLALLHRRARRFEDAASCWQQLLAWPGCPPGVVREAGEALAIHHEHRVRDLAVAKAFALRSLDAVASNDEGPRPQWTEALQHRVKRIEKKMNKSQLSRFNSQNTGRLRLET